MLWRQAENWPRIFQKDEWRYFQRYCIGSFRLVSGEAALFGELLEIQEELWLVSQNAEPEQGWRCSRSKFGIELVNEITKCERIGHVCGLDYETNSLTKDETRQSPLTIQQLATEWRTRPPREQKLLEQLRRWTTEPTCSWRKHPGRSYDLKHEKPIRYRELNQPKTKETGSRHKRIKIIILTKARKDKAITTAKERRKPSHGGEWPRQWES